VVASDLDAFARVLENGAAGVLVRRGDPAALAAGLSSLLADPDRRAQLSAAGSRTAADYDWSVVARRILVVYETVTAAAGGGVTASSEDDAALLGPAPSAGGAGRGRPTTAPTPPAEDDGGADGGSDLASAWPFRRRVRR
jgi:phosphatidylinositol alpha-mannosyltransferase